MSMSVTERFSAMILCLLGYCCLTSPTIVFAQQEYDIAEAVWVDTNAGKWSILFSKYSNDEWSMPESVYVSDAQITTPAIVRDKQGHNILVWSERNKKKLALKQSIRLAGENDWGEAVTIYDRGFENISPAMVVDLSGRLWLFWCSDQGSDSLSDIYAMSSTNYGEWGSSFRVNKPNEVPDLHPFAALTESGDVSVRWNSYSLLANSYQPSESIVSEHSGSEPGAETTTITDDVTDINAIPLPPGFPNNALGGISFPKNYMIQSRRLYDSGSQPQ